MLYDKVCITCLKKFSTTSPSARRCSEHEHKNTKYVRQYKLKKNYPPEIRKCTRCKAEFEPVNNYQKRCSYCNTRWKHPKAWVKHGTGHRHHTGLEVSGGIMGDLMAGVGY